MDIFFEKRFAFVFYGLQTLLLAGVAVFLFKLYTVRKRTLELRRQGFAMPPLNPVFGHLLVLASIMSKLPKDAHQHYLPDQLRRTYPEMGPIFYIDAWPIITFTLVVASPSTLAQITTDRTLNKFPAIRDFLFPLTNGKDIVSMDGQQWKFWRNVFNPGFSAKHLMTVVPDIVQETAVFCNVLQKHAAKKDVIPMKTLTDNLTMDVIGKVVLNSNLNSQLTSNPMVNALRRQMRWMAFGSEGNPFQQYHPLRPFVHIYNTWQMDRYISPEVDARFAMRKDQDKPQGKSVIDLALTAYLKENPAAKASQDIDSAFKKLAMSQMKLFLFSGHDTTSSSICFILYLLSIHPDSLSRLRAEHNQVFGCDPSAAAMRITEDPHLLNKLPYTVAVIKESIRLFPAASATRSGEPDLSIADSEGRQYPTEGCLVWLITHAVQHDPSYWPQADDYIPDRWLCSPGDPLHPVKGAWRPFEHGPRACIGLELSMIEVKIVLALVVRTFGIEAAYKELDAGATDKHIKTVNGDRVYQCGAGQPCENLPCRVNMV
ncbi:hypothetical protein MMC13_000445 [Lambiella insularis]|nr:hypothetical protein [Lambiella insularis]